MRAGVPWATVRLALPLRCEATGGGSLRALLAHCLWGPLGQPGVASGGLPPLLHWREASSGAVGTGDCVPSAAGAPYRGLGLLVTSVFWAPFLMGLPLYHSGVLVLFRHHSPLSTGPLMASPAERGKDPQEKAQGPGDPHTES